MRSAAAILLVGALATGARAGETPVCHVYASPAVRVGTVPAPLLEMSGLATSRRHPGVYWSQNDSGNPFEIYAIRPDGSIVARFPLRGGDNVDCEDIAVGPCRSDPKGSCVYLADIGDNLELRPRVAIYEIPEPERLVEQTLQARRLAYRYPDRPHNAEALLVDPHAGTLYVVTKELETLGTLFRLDDLAFGKVGRAVRIRTLRAPSGFGALATAGAVHPSGRRILLRTYSHVWEYRGRAGDPIETLLATTPVGVPSATQPQGEAVTYTSDGLGYLLGTEKAGSPLYRVDCATP